MLDQFGTNPTQLIGILSFALTTIACLVATYRSREARTWKVLALLNALFLLEVIVGLRFRVLDLARTHLQEKGLYPQLHGEEQTVVIVALMATAVILILLFWLLPRVAGPAARVGISLTIFLLALFAIETVSLHDIDAIFYRRVGPFVLVGCLWATASAGIFVAALSSR